MGFEVTLYLEEGWTDMANDRRSQLARRFLKSVAKKRMLSGDLFSIELADGETGFCLILGDDDDTPDSLMLYRGDEGLDSLSAYAEELALSNRDQPGNPRINVLLSVNALMFMQKQNGLPAFMRMQAGHAPQPIQEDGDVRDLCDALEACVELGERLEGGGTLSNLLTTQNGGEQLWLRNKSKNYEVSSTRFPALVPYIHPSPYAVDSMLTAYIRLMKREGMMECEVTCLPDPLDDGRLEVTLLGMWRNSRHLLATAPITDYEKSSGSMLDGFEELLAQEDACPEQIFVRDRRTYALLRDLCRTCQIKLVMTASLPRVDEMRDKL